MKELYRRLFSNNLVAIELFAASFFANILALASPIFVMQVLNRYVSFGVDSTLATLAVGVVIAIFLEFGFRQVRLRLAEAITCKPDEKISLEVFAKFIGIKSVYLDRMPNGLRHEITKDVEKVQRSFSANNIASLLDVPFSLLFVIALMFLNPVISFITIFFMVFVFVISTITQKKLRKPVKEMMNQNAYGGSIVSASISASDTLRAFNAKGFMLKIWEEHSKKTDFIKKIISSRQSFLQSMIQSSSALMGACIITVAAVYVVTGEMNVGGMIGANILAGRALSPISKLAQLGEAFSKAEQSMERIKTILKMASEPVKGMALGEYKGNVEFKDVSFAYAESTGPLFENMDLQIPAGKVLIVKGANGTGKTTLARMIAGLLEPDRGQILVDGIDLRQMAPEWWRRQIAYLPQEPKLLNTTIKQNIMVVAKEPDEKKLNEVIKAADLKSFVDKNPDGVSTKVSGCGANFSLGIRRRIAFARALMSECKVLVVDEPTEGLDADGCKAMYSVLNDMVKKGRTVVAFSHDPNIVKGAQIVLDIDSKPVPKISYPSFNRSVPV